VFLDVFQLHDKKYRMNNLYHIVDRDGNDMKFVMTPIQEDVLDNLHSRNLILKARQLGMSTFSVLYILDEAIFNENKSCGIVSYSLQHAQHIFKRIIGHALDNLPKDLGNIGIIQQSANEITFSNGSHLRVDTTLRGGTCQIVLVSEFGKTCARSPQKAEEIITGTLQTVAQEGKIIIESTGEGNSGFFAEMCTNAALRGNDNLSALDYKLFFYPWFDEPSYSIDHKIVYDVELTDYFNKLEADSDGKIEIKEPQRRWYAQQKIILHDKIKQEFPSTINESFLSSSEAYYYAEHVERAYNEGRCLSTSLYDALLPVYVAMDIAVNDLTAITFFQLSHGEIRIIDFYEDNNKGIDFYANFLMNDKRYIYNTIFLPHDAAHRDGLIVENTYAREFGRIFAHTNTRFQVLARTDRNLGITQAQNKFARCVFAIKRTKSLLDHLSKYRKKWHEGTGRYLDEPLHDIHCFTGETLISTPNGKVKIKDILIGDYVLTPNGSKKVTAKFDFKTKELININTTTSQITCTKHHKVFSNKGLVTADTLGYNDILITNKDKRLCQNITYLGMEKCAGFRSYFSLMSRETLATLMGISTQETKEDISLERFGKAESQIVNLFTDRFGVITMVKSLKVIIFTTLTKINQIMQSKICGLLKEESILECTCSHPKDNLCQEKALKLHLKKQKNGMDQKQETNGTLKTEKKLSQRRNLLSYLVNSVRKVLNQFGQKQNTAKTPASQQHAEKKELTTYQETVKSVKKNLFAIDTRKRERVLQNAEVYLEEEVNVYDIQVEDDHCYFANNILVSNSDSSDSFRYAMIGVNHIETVGNMSGALDKHKKLVDNRRMRI
jgi:hypothetical protein